MAQPGSQVSIEMSYKIKAFGHAYLVLYTTILLFQQTYIASIGVTTWASEAWLSVPSG